MPVDKTEDYEQLDPKDIRDLIMSELRDVWDAHGDFNEYQKLRKHLELSMLSEVTQQLAGIRIALERLADK